MRRDPEADEPPAGSEVDQTVVRALSALDESLERAESNLSLDQLTRSCP